MARQPTPDGRRVHMNVKFSEAEAAAVDEARGETERGVWLRETVLRDLPLVVVAVTAPAPVPVKRSRAKAAPPSVPAPVSPPADPRVSAGTATAVFQPAGAEPVVTAPVPPKTPVVVPSLRRASDLPRLRAARIRAPGRSAAGACRARRRFSRAGSFRRTGLSRKAGRRHERPRLPPHSRAGRGPPVQHRLHWTASVPAAGTVADGAGLGPGTASAPIPDDRVDSRRGRPSPAAPGRRDAAPDDRTRRDGRGKVMTRKVCITMAWRWPFSRRYRVFHWHRPKGSIVNCAAAARRVADVEHPGAAS